MPIILKGATFTKTFADGFEAGYRSGMGNDAVIPPIPPPPPSIPEGVGAYLSGVTQGIAAALKERPVRKTWGVTSLRRRFGISN